MVGEQATALRCRRMMILGLLAAVLLTIVTAYYYTAKVAGRAEFAYQSRRIAFEAVEAYVEEHGRWPSSWDDLGPIGDIQVGKDAWPSDHEPIRSKIAIDFGLSLEDVARQDPEHFTAIRSRGPVYGNGRELAESLIETIERQFPKHEGQLL